MRRLEEIGLLDRRVLVRADLEGTGPVLGRKLAAAAPTIAHILSKGGRPIIVAQLSPVGGKVPTMRSTAEGLSALLGWEVRLIGGDPPTWQLALNGRDADGIVLLENMLLHPGESDNDPALAEELAALADIYVNDDFSTTPHVLASTVGAADRVHENAIGPRLWNELDTVDRSMNDPLRPLVAIIGGNDVPAKLRTVRHMVTRADRILIGGAVAFAFLEAQGMEVGLSATGDDMISEAQEIIEMAEEEGTALVLPSDVIMAKTKDADAEGEEVSVKDINPHWMGLDIGPATVNRFLAAIKDAKTIIWNGSMGAWEIEQFSQGTMAMAFAVANSHAYSVVGGSGTVSALERSGEAPGVCHISLGGDAFRAILSGEILPGAEILGWRCREPL